MNCRINKFACAAALCLMLTSCYGSWNIFYKGNDVDYRTTSMLKVGTASDPNQSVFTASGVSSVSGTYKVLVLSDIHAGYTGRTPPDRKLFRWLNSVKDTSEAPQFMLCLGDTSDTGEQSQFDEYNAFCQKLKDDYDIKLIFNAAGNHDIYQSHWDVWKKNCYPYTSFYKFETAGFSWYCLDTASGTISKQQYDILTSELAGDTKPKVVFSHYPLSEYNLAFGLGDTTERNLLISKFIKSNVKCYLGGHNHYSKETWLGFPDYECPSYRYNYSWTVVTVNESTGSVTAEFFK